MRHRPFYFGLLVAALLATGTMLGCGPAQPASLSSSTSSSAVAAATSTSAPAAAPTTSSIETSTPTSYTDDSMPTSDVRLSAGEVRVLQKINQIRTGLADGTWALSTWPFGPVTSDSPDIDISLKDPPTGVSALEKEIKAMPEVVRVTYVSKDEWLALLKEILRDSPDDLARLEGDQSDPMPASLQVWLKDRSPASATKFARKIEGRAEVDESWGVSGPSVINPLDGDGADLVDDPDYPSASSEAEELLDEAEQPLYYSDVTVYLKTSVGDVSSLLAEVAAMPQVAKVDFVSLEQARAIMTNEFKDTPGLISGAQANASPTLEIWLKDASQSESVASALRAHPEVEEVPPPEGNDAGEDPFLGDSLDVFYQRSQTKTSAAALKLVDRHDPETVLRAYFSAWEKGKWQEETLYMASLYSNLVPEPAKSLQIVDLKRLESSSSHCLFSVAFDFVPLGAPISMEAGRYTWTYDLNWDGQRQSWIITNYGEG